MDKTMNEKNKYIYVHAKEHCVRTLGPGERFVLWTAGCGRRCPGCTTPESWDMHAGRKISVDELRMEIVSSGREGLTISGGEPFLQAEALARLIRGVRRFTDIGVIVYTGYTYEELTAMPQAAGLLAETDLLIDGPYIRELDDGKSLRGSSNQRILPLTDRYIPDLWLYGNEGRKREVFNYPSGVAEVGIPNDSKVIKL
jgi:anaerobic ribonucleoside-triphosphate reductase activating protein